MQYAMQKINHKAWRKASKPFKIRNNFTSETLTFTNTAKESFTNKQIPPFRYPKVLWLTEERNTVQKF
jgi:hypothetical protein